MILMTMQQKKKSRATKQYIEITNAHRASRNASAADRASCWPPVHDTNWWTDFYFSTKIFCWVAWAAAGVLEYDVNPTIGCVSHCKCKPAS